MAASPGESLGKPGGGGLQPLRNPRYGVTFDAL
jgi:hypothetical protein